MTVRLISPRQSKEFPETVLWAMAKAERQLQARVRFLPLGDCRPELRIDVTDRASVFDLLKSALIQANEDLRDVAQR